MHDDQLRALFTKARTIAILGAKDTPGYSVDRVGRYLMAAGFQVIPVHVTRKNVWGLPTYTCLEQITAPMDIVNLFRAGEFCSAHARECLTLSTLPQTFWMQLCIESQESVDLLVPHGLNVIQNSCIMVEHARLFNRPLPEGSDTACAFRPKTPRSPLLPTTSDETV